MLVIQRLEEMQNFSSNEKQVAKYLIQNQSKINKISINEIAADTYTSPSTTVRLSKKLGYDGWKELRTAISDELKYIQEHFQNIDPNFPFTKQDTIMDISKKIGSLMADTIYDSMNLIEHDTLQQVVLKLVNASNIYIYGITNAVGVAYDFKYAMRTIGKRVEVIENVEEFQYTVYSTKKDDVSIFISYSGQNLELLSFVKELNLKNCYTVAITSLGDNTLSKLCDVTLYMTTREKLYSKINNYTSKESTHYLLNVLFSCVFAYHYDENKTIKMNLSKKIDTKRSSALELLKEEEN